MSKKWLFSHVQHPSKDILYPIKRTPEGGWYVILPEQNKTISASDVHTLNKLVWEACREGIE